MNETVNELFIDVSEYDPPEPFEAVIELLKKMKKGDYIRMLHRKKPLPLFQFLQEHGFAYLLKETAENKAVHKLWTIIIWKESDARLNDYCMRHF
jgi:uncharacterized protein (DUF2249 family)